MSENRQSKGMTAILFSEWIVHEIAIFVLAKAVSPELQTGRFFFFSEVSDNFITTAYYVKFNLLSVEGLSS